MMVVVVVMDIHMAGCDMADCILGVVVVLDDTHKIVDAVVGVVVVVVYQVNSLNFEDEPDLINIALVVVVVVVDIKMVVALVVVVEPHTYTYTVAYSDRSACRVLNCK
jgi:hypothetical protein